MTGTKQVAVSFAGELADGTTFAARVGDTIDASHPAVKRWPDYFEDQTLDHVVEAATAAPGEKRATRKAAKEAPAPEPKVEAATAAPGEQRK